MVTLLDVACFLLLLRPGCRGGHPQPAPGNVSLISDMKLDARKKTLTWTSRWNVTQQKCKIDTPQDPPTCADPQDSGNNTFSCAFPNSVLHAGATLTVTVSADGQQFQEVLPFHNPGRAGSGAENFSCLIYDTSAMNCSWAPGPAAPADVRYRLFVWASRDEAEAECPQYLLSPAGTPVGCHFGELAAPTSADNYFFLLNGTSNETDVRFVDFPPFVATQMEKYNPPANLSARFNGSHHLVRWDNPRTRFRLSSHILCYELHLQREGSLAARDPMYRRGQDENVLPLPAAAVPAGSFLRARLKHAYAGAWSEWSSPLHLGLPESDPSGSWVHRAGTAVGATALLGTVLTLVCRRFSLQQRLFPPIPQVSSEVACSLASGPQKLWDGGSPPVGWLDPEEVLVVQEMCPAGITRPAEPQGPRTRASRTAAAGAPRLDGASSSVSAGAGSRPAMAALWLAALLTPACCLLPTGPDPRSPPIKNLRVEPREGRLTWDLSGGVSGITCSVDASPDMQATNNQYCLVKPYLVEKCKAKNFTVTVKSPQRFSTSILYPPQEGTPGAEAAGLECWVHDGTVLTCRWGAGPAAPPDVRYRLYWEDLGSGAERECARYQVDARGARVGCSFGDVSRASAQLQRLLVKGRAQGSAVPCSEVIASLREIERLSAPNLTGTCNHSHAVLRWEPPSRLQNLLVYELQLQKEAHPPEQVTLTDNWVVLPNPGDFVLRIKAQSFLPRNISSEWSAPHRFSEWGHPAGQELPVSTSLCPWLLGLQRGPGSHPRPLRSPDPEPGWPVPLQAAPLSRFWVTVAESMSSWSREALGCRPEGARTGESEGARSGILVALALGTLLPVGVVLLLCWRYSLAQKLFPPIPGVKDPLRDLLEEKMVVSKDTEDCPVAQVQVVGET
ncbi:uncharacterized protein LOC119245760 [Talpa occidentalis]|uniref:uncharacterized protein LOC119245760 n=1 Tax=Talpa occidentalis TaxID=50954 RepID=UPI00188E8463|nr:uncharacterized protein LOC119245760 [Talpa occidentalis]